jgi:hypothetical protein
MFVIHRLHDALSRPLIYNSATKPVDKAMMSSADGFSSTFVMPSSAARAAMAGDGAPVTSRTGNCHPSPEPDSQFQTSDVGHVVVKDKAAHAVEVATLQKLVSRGIVDYLISGKCQQERQRLTHGVVVIN